MGGARGAAGSPPSSGCRVAGAGPRPPRPLHDYAPTPQGQGPRRGARRMRGAAATLRGRARPRRRAWVTTAPPWSRAGEVLGP